MIGNFRKAQSQNCEKRLVASPCLSVRMKQLGSHWKNFHEIWCLHIFRKAVEEIQALLKHEKSNGYFTWRRTDSHDNISLSSTLEREIFHAKVVEKIKTHILREITFFPENSASYGMVWKNTAQPNRSLCFARWITTATDTHSEYCFPTTKLFSRTRANITFYVHCLSCFP